MKKGAKLSTGIFSIVFFAIGIYLYFFKRSAGMITLGGEVLCASIVCLCVGLLSFFENKITKILFVISTTILGLYYVYLLIFRSNDVVRILYNLCPLIFAINILLIYFKKIKTVIPAIIAVSFYTIYLGTMLYSVYQAIAEVNKAMSNLYASIGNVPVVGERVTSSNGLMNWITGLGAYATIAYSMVPITMILSIVICNVLKEKNNTNINDEKNNEDSI